MVAVDHQAAPAGAIAIQAEPGEVDAGAQLTLTGTLIYPAGRTSGDEVLSIRNEQGMVLAGMPVTPCEDRTTGLFECALRAPLAPGEHTWLAVFAGMSGEGDPAEDISAPVVFVVRPHATSVVVWDVPPAIVAGEVFGMKVGVKCSAQCPPAGWTFEVLDHDGARVANGALGKDPWPGTAALYFAELELKAPRAIGLHKWSVTAPAAALEVPHEPHTVSFGVRTVRRAQYLLRVEAVDRQSRSPVKGAKVAVHPYRTFTDERGIAELRVPRGHYRIFVSGIKYVPFRTESDISGNLKIRAELDADVGLTEADLWS